MSMTTNTYPADRTALLNVDPYNDFMSDGGELFEATREATEAVGFCDNIRRLVLAIRAARIRVIIVPHHRWKHLNPSQDRRNELRGFAAGTWGGEFHRRRGRTMKHKRSVRLPREPPLATLPRFRYPGISAGVTARSTRAAPRST
jgi:hypothetical protein